MLERWPEVAAEVKEAPAPNFCLAQTAQRTLLIGGRHLTSGFNRTGEAEQQAATIPKTATEAWVYGHALGDCITQLLMRGCSANDERAKLDKVHVVVMSRGITQVVRGFDGGKWMAWARNPRVELHMARDIGDVRRPFCVSPVEVHQCDEDAERLRARIMAILNVEFNEINLQARRKVELEQYEANKPTIESCGFVDRLYDTSTLPAIICGGGPTLAESYDWVRDRADSHVIIAASTALKPLMGAGIRPDIIVVIDPAADIWKHFDGVDLDALVNARLVFIPSCHPKVVAAWKGLLSCAAVTVHHPGDLFSGGSVVHAATDLAVKMGARHVYFCGLDFCYPGDRSHVDGAANPFEVAGKSQAWREKTTNGLGERVTTSAEMMQYAAALEDYVKAHPGVAFRKRGKRGLPLHGVKWDD